MCYSSVSEQGIIQKIQQIVWIESYCSLTTNTGTVYRGKQEESKMNPKVKKWQELLFFAVMGAVGIFLIWKCRYGFANRDEAFYLTVPYRLCQGDGLVGQEWHLSQLPGVLLAPFVAGYLKLVGSTEGILLAARYFCTAVWWTAGLYFYFLLRKYSKVGAMAVSLFFVLYIPFGIMAFSYNSMGILALLLSLILFLKGTERQSFLKKDGRGERMQEAAGKKSLAGKELERSKKEAVFAGRKQGSAEKEGIFSGKQGSAEKAGTFVGRMGASARGTFLLSGLFFSWAVLCCPYLAVGYVLYLLWALTPVFGGERKQARREAALFFTLGAAGSGVLFLGFLLSRNSWEEILAAIPWMLKDPEHGSVSLMAGISRYFAQIFHSTRSAPLICTGFGILAVFLGALSLLEQGRKPHRGIKQHRGIRQCCLLAACGLTLWYLASVLMDKPRLNYLMFPLNLLGLICLLIEATPQKQMFFRIFYLPGMFYSLCISFASNQKFYTIASASTVALAGSVMILGEEIRRIRNRRSALAAESTGRRTADGAALVLISLCFLFQAGAEAYLRYRTVFWEPSMREQNCLIQEGPEAGILASREKKDSYQSMMEDTRAVWEEAERQPVLYLSKVTWLYFFGDTECASYSAWTSGINPLTMERLEAYYR